MFLMHHIFGPALLLSAITISGLALRLILVLNHEPYLGIDGGAYLLGMQQVLGQNPVGQDFTRPPLAPGWLLVPFAHLWGYDIGYKIWSAVFSMAPVPVVYLLARQYGASVNAALLATTVAAFSMLHAELLVTGALPLIGFAVIGLGMWAISKVIECRGPAPWLILVACFPLVVVVNMTSAGIAGIAWAAYALAFIRFDLERIAGFMPLVASATVGALLALPIVFLYYGDVMFGSGNLRHPGPLFVLAPLGNWGWFVLVLGSALAVATVKYGQTAAVKACGPVLLVFSLLAVVWSFDESIINITFRGRYFVAFLAVPVVAALLKVPSTLRVAFAVALVSISAFSYVRAFNAQAYYSQQISVETAQALQLAKRLDPTSAIIVNSFSMAWWTQALNGVPAPAVWTSPPGEKWKEEYGHVRCVLGWDCRGILQHGNTVWAVESGLALDARFVLLDVSFPDRNETFIDDAPEGNPWAPAERAEWLRLIYSKGDTRLYQVR